MDKEQINHGTPWTQEEMQFLFEGRTNFPPKPYSLIGAELGRTVDSCQCKFRDTNWEKKGFTVDPVVDEERYASKSKFTGQVVDSLSRKHHAHAIRADAIADALERAVECLPKAPLTKYVPNKKVKGDRHPEDIGLILSDLHIGHEHTMADTGGISEYNVDIYKKRMQNLQAGMTEICELHRSYTKISTLRIFCLGDIVAGMNAVGQWSPIYVRPSIVDQMMEGFYSLRDAIWYWLTFFDNIEFYGIGGNHGRTAQQGVQPDRDNWDYVCYQLLQVAFGDNPRIKFHVPKTWWYQDTIRSHNFLLVHGDYTRNGRPMNALSNFYQNMSNIVQASKLPRPNYLLAGHFHNSAEETINGGRILLNGSFVGADVYSLRNVHRYSPPEQKIFGIHDQHGITWTCNINLDIERSL